MVVIGVQRVPTLELREERRVIFAAVFVYSDLCLYKPRNNADKRFEQLFDVLRILSLAVSLGIVLERPKYYMCYNFISSCF